MMYIVDGAVPLLDGKVHHAASLDAVQLSLPDKDTEVWPDALLTLSDVDVEAESVYCVPPPVRSISPS